MEELRLREGDLTNGHSYHAVITISCISHFFGSKIHSFFSHVSISVTELGGSY